MKLNGYARERLRNEVLKELKKHDFTGKIRLDKNVLDCLLFETILIDGVRIKLPVWTGAFLSKLDLRDVDFEDVAFSLINNEEKSNLSQDIINMINVVKKDNIFNDSSKFNDCIDFSNTNAYINLSTSFEAKNLGYISLINCNFKNVNLRVDDDAIIKEIVNCDLENTSLNIQSADVNKGSLRVKNSNLTGLNLSSYNLNILDFIANKEIIDRKSAIKNTNIHFNFNIKDADNTSKTRIGKLIKDGVLEGCFINNNYVSGKMLLLQKKNDMRVLYDAIKSYVFSLAYKNIQSSSYLDYFYLIQYFYSSNYDEVILNKIKELIMSSEINRKNKLHMNNSLILSLSYYAEAYKNITGYSYELPDWFKAFNDIEIKYDNIPIKLSKSDINALRLSIKKCLESCASSLQKRVEFDTNLLRDLLFEVLPSNKKLYEKIIIPVFSGDFLSLVDLHNVDFSNVSWAYTNLEDYKIFFDEESWNLFNKSDYFPTDDAKIQYRNTNAKIDLKNSWECLKDGTITLNNCDFYGTDLSHNDIQNKMVINNSNLEYTKLKLPIYNNKYLMLMVKNSNLTGLNLSGLTLDGISYLENSNNVISYDTDIKHTGVNIININHESLDKSSISNNTLIRRLRHKITNGELNGCKINGILVPEQDDCVIKKKEINDEYNKMVTSMINSLKESIDQQIEAQKKLTKQ